MVTKATTTSPIKPDNSLEQAYRNLAEWLISTHNGIFTEADIPKRDKVNILHDLNFSVNTINEE